MTDRIELSDKAWDKLMEITEKSENSEPSPALVELFRGHEARRERLAEQGITIREFNSDEVKRIMATPDAELTDNVEQSIKAILERPQGKLH